AARGLALGWGARLSGYSSTSLLAAATFAAHPTFAQLAVVLEGGHGEVFMQSFTAAPFAAADALASRRPDAALAALGGRVAVG
ncbi:hypothetical protein ACO1ND_14155, partial [Staphylococcus aureus]